MTNLILVTLLSLSLVLVLLSSVHTIATYGSVSKEPSNNTISYSNPRLVDPNPHLIDEDGNMKNDVSLAATNISKTPIGTIADGISKLVLVVDSINTLKFSIKGTDANNLTNGTLSSLNQSSTASNSPSSSTTIVSPQSTSNGSSVVAAVYTPPDYINLTAIDNNRTTISILVNDTIEEPRLSIGLYRVPVVLVHGIWTNSNFSWILTNFSKTLVANGFDISFADYGRYNATTFDPYADKKIGNYGIDSVRQKINAILKDYHDNSIAASQVDILAHSMGGLMARGFTQQPDYKNKTNFMEGSIHRLLTIGTPHFGAHLAKILYDHRDDWYCFDPTIKPFKPTTKAVIFPIGCQFDLDNFEFMQLKTIYANKFLSPIDKGGVEALIPRSTAYSHLCQTNVSSYAIAGTWAPDAFASHQITEGLFKNILGNPLFDLDTDGFQGQGDFEGNNDLQINLTSQVGGLHSAFRKPNDNNIPNESAVYLSTVHGSFLIPDHDEKKVFAELNSPQIQKDVVSLLNSSNEKFADVIGIGSPCYDHVKK